MKTILIYERSILERTNFKKWRYKEALQVSIFYNNKEYKNHYQEIDNSKLKQKFNLVLKTRTKKELENYINDLGYSNADKWQKSILKEIIENE